VIFDCRAFSGIDRGSDSFRMPRRIFSPEISKFDEKTILCGIDCRVINALGIR
jgi:hypothetical protein